MCCRLRDVVLFLAGAEFFHTLAHVMMSYFMTMPVDMKIMLVTSTMNNYAIVGNALVTVLLLWWVRRLSCKCWDECKSEVMSEVKVKAKSKK